MNCPKCQAEMLLGETVCKNCGRPLSPEAPSLFDVSVTEGKGIAIGENPTVNITNIQSTPRSGSLLRWGIGLLVAAGLALLIYLLLRPPQFEITVFGRHKRLPAIEVTDMLLWNPGGLAGDITTAMPVQVKPQYNGLEHYGKVVARVRSTTTQKELEFPLWQDFTRLSETQTFTLTLPVVLSIAGLPTVEAASQSAFQNEAYVPEDTLEILILPAGEDEPLARASLPVRNAPWRQSFVFERDAANAQIKVHQFVQNDGLAGDFLFRYYLWRLYDQVSASTTTYQNAENISDGFTATQGHLEAGGILTGTAGIHYPSDTPGHYLLEVYAVKQLAYVDFVDPAYTWSSPKNPWWFSRRSIYHYFIVPGQDIPVEGAFKDTVAKLGGQGVSLGRPLAFAQEVTSPLGTQGLQQPFENGLIVAYNDQAYAIHGPVYRYYRQLLQDNPDLKLGFPTGDIQDVRSRYDTPGQVQPFEGAIAGEKSLLYVTGGDAGLVEGWIARVYEQMGGPEGWLGFPVSRPIYTRDSHYILFEHGYMMQYYPVVEAPDQRDYSHAPEAFLYPGSHDLRQVQAGRDWQDTGITVKSGDRLFIDRIGGSWTSGGGWFFGNGDPLSPPSDDRPLPGVYGGALIGRIGDGAPFLVGDSGVIDAPADGTLYLMMNTASLADNSGELTVQILVEAGGS